MRSIGDSGYDVTCVNTWPLQKIGDKFPNVNVITIDYRGFGNSEGTPSEEGLRMDARATWDWLRQRGGNNTMVVGKWNLEIIGALTNTCTRSTKR